MDRDKAGRPRAPDPHLQPRTRTTVPQQFKPSIADRQHLRSGPCTDKERGSAPEQALSAGRPTSAVRGKGTKVDDRARCGHAQALAHPRGRRRGHRRVARRQDRPRSASAGSPRRWTGRAASATSGCGRWRTAGMSRAPWSGSCSSTANASFASRRRLMAGERRAGRDRGKSDPHRRARRRPRGAQGRRRSAAGRRAGRRRARHRGCWSITASGWSACAPRSTTTLLWHLHDLWPEQTFPAARCSRRSGHARIARRLARAEQTDAGPHRPRRAAPPARALRTPSTRCRPRSPTWSPRSRPQLLAEPGFGPLTAAKLIGEIAGAAALRQRRQARPRRRDRPDPGQLSQHQPPPPRPRRQPPDQHRRPPRRRHAPALPPRDQGLHRPQARRRQDQHAKPSAASSATSPAASGTCSRRPTPSEEHLHQHQFS